MKHIAIIPARSGSKRLKDKNIKLLNGKPLMAYSIEAAIESGIFDEIFVSTDSEKYAVIAREYGANVPFLRDELLSSDTTTSVDVILDTLVNYKKAGKEFDFITLLQPTSPLRTAEDVLSGYQMMKEKNADSVISVCQTDYSPLLCNLLPDSHSLENFINEQIVNNQIQNMPVYYKINGALYIFRTKFLEADTNFYRKGSYAMIMNKKRSIDIDDEFDFLIAEALLSINK